MIKLRGFSEAKTIATVEAPVTVTSSLNAAIINNGDNSFEIIIDRNRASLLTRPNVWLIGSSTANAAGASSEETSLRGLLKAHVENTLFGTFNYLALNGYWTNKFLPYGNPLTDYHRNIDATLTMDNVFTDDTPRGDEIVIISLPSNDVVYNTVEQFIDNLRIIFNRCKERGVHCFITQTQPRDDYDDAQKLDLRLSALLIEATFPDNCIRIFDDLTDDVASIKPQYYSYHTSGIRDTIHVNDAGHALICSRTLSRWDAYFIDREIDHYKIERSLTSNFTSYTVLLDDIDPAQLRHTFQRSSEDLWYYRIRAVAANGTSIVSNTISLQQAEFVGEILRKININLLGSEFPTEVVGTSEWNDFMTLGFTSGSTVYDAGPADIFNNLLDNTGGATSIGIAILGEFEVAEHNGDSAGNFMPDQVARAYISSRRGGSVDATGDKGAFRIFGLNPALPHNIYVYCNRNSSGLTRYVGAYCNGRYGAVLAAQNIDTLLSLEGIKPTVEGYADIYISGLIFGIGYVNAVIVEERDSVFKISFAPEDIIIEETGFLINPIPDGADTLKLNITGSAVSGEAGWQDLNIQRDIEYDLDNSIGGASGLKLYFYDIAANPLDNGAGYGGTDTWPAATQRYVRNRTLGFDFELRDVLANEAINWRFLITRLNSTLTTRITINGNAQSVFVGNNHGVELVFEGIRGDASGTILVEVDNVLGSGTCYCPKMIIKRVAQQTVGVDVVFDPEDIVIEETSFIVDVAPLITFDAEDITVEETSFEVTSGTDIVDIIFDAEDIIVEETGFNLGISFSPEDIIVEETSFEVSPSTPIVPFSFTTGHFYKPGYEGALYISRYDATKQTKVIFALSGSNVATITAAINQGAADYINDGDRPELPDYNVIIFIPCNNADNLWGGTADHIFLAYKYIRDNYTVSHNIDWDFCGDTGLSLGGRGVLNGCFKNQYSYVEADDLTEFGPRNLLWSAGFIVCGSASSGVSGGVNVDVHYDELNHMAIWTLHGTNDTTQNFNNTPKIINGINAQNPVNPPRSTWFWNTGHDIYHNHTYNRFNKTDSSGVRIGSGTAATASKSDWFEWITKYSRDPVKNATSLVNWAERGSNWTHPYMDYLEAFRAVNNLSAGATKTALLARLATFKTQFSRVWIIDYGQLASVSAGNINNITNQNTGQTVSNLITDDGSASIVGLNIPSKTGTDVDGVAFTSQVNGEHWGFPKTFMKDGRQVITSLTNGADKFTGLNGSKKYEVLLFHLSTNTNNTAKADIHVTAVQAVGDIVKTQYSEFNTSTFIYFGRGILGINNDVNESLTPIGGELTFNIRCNTGSFTSRNTNVVGIILIELP